MAANTLNDQASIWPYLWPIVTAVVAGAIGYVAGKAHANRQIRSREMTAEYEKVRIALDAYIVWLALLRLHIDPSDSAGLGMPAAPIPTGGIRQVRSHLDELAAAASAGRELKARLDHAKYDLHIPSTLLAQLGEVVDAVGEQYEDIRTSQWPADSIGGRDYYTWVLSQESIGLTQLAAKEVFLAETIFGDLRRELHRVYKQGILGWWMLRGYDDDTGITSKGSVKRKWALWHPLAGHLSHEGEIPFRSPRYVSERDLPMKEWLESQSRHNEPKAEPGSDE